MAEHRDIADRLMGRLQVAAGILASADGPPPRGWRGDFLPRYRMNEKLRVSWYPGPGSDIWYARLQHHGRDRAAIQVWNLNPAEMLRDEEVVAYPTSAPDIIDGATIPLPNYHGLTDMGLTYEPNFRDAITESDVMLIGFEEAAKITAEFSQGSEAAQYKFKQTIEASFTARQEKTKATEKANERGRRVEYPVTAPPGVDLEYTATMTVQQKKVRTTGFGDVDFGFAIGLRTPKGKGGRDIWSRHRNNKRHCRWQSFWNEFIPVVKGERRGGP